MVSVQAVIHLQTPTSPTSPASRVPMFLNAVLSGGLFESLRVRRIFILLSGSLTPTHSASRFCMSSSLFFSPLLAFLCGVPGQVTFCDLGPVRVLQGPVNYCCCPVLVWFASERNTVKASLGICSRGTIRSWILSLVSYR